MKNIKYKSKSFLRYYSQNRMTWNEFYLSERIILERVIKKFEQGINIIDVGCGCGGLGKALSERFDNIHSYVGIDYDDKQIEYARAYNKLKIPHEYRCGDASVFSDDQKYDILISFSCIDYNLDVTGMLTNCWDKVKPGGYLITSVRLTENDTINDISRAYQIADGKEKANYVVFNWKDFLHMLTKLENNQVDEIEAYGYWHSPAPEITVVEYDRLCMSVFAIRKSLNAEMEKTPIIRLELPCDLLIKEKK